MVSPKHIPDVRNLVASINPFTFGRFPQRIAPAHVANGVVASAIGVSARGALIRHLLSDDVDVPDEFGFAQKGNWPGTDDELLALRRSLGLVLNPDRRSWKDVGSLAPVHAGVSTRDASDDGLGPVLWALLEHSSHDFKGALTRLLNPTDIHDPVTRATVSLLGDDPVQGDRRLELPESVWFGKKGTPAGQDFAFRLADFLWQLVQEYPDGRRIMAIQHLSRGLYFVAFLCLLWGPILASNHSSKPLHTRLPLLLWGGVPPGHGHDPMVVASQRSFQTAVRMNRDALASSLSTALSGQDLPSGLPANQKMREAVKGRLVASGADVKKAVERLETAGISLSGSNPGDAEWTSQLVASAYSRSYLSSGFRTMGVKIGFLAPAGGQGAPRFVCETPLLGTLVEGICPVGESMRFDDFVDSLRVQLGIVVGPGSSDAVVDEVGFWEASGTGRKLLISNQEAFRRRLIRTGMAREYSDRHTEVFNSA